MSAYSITSRGLAGRKIPQGTLTPMGALLFSASEPGAWYDPSDLSTLFQDAAGTTPVTAVEQPVGRRLDKSGRGNHATQATTTKRPVLSRLVNKLTATDTCVGWSSNVGVTLEANAAPSPSGPSTATIVTTTGSGYHAVAYTGVAWTGAATRSVELKKGNWRYVGISDRREDGGGVVLDFDTGTVLGNSRLLNPTVVPLGDGWFRVGFSVSDYSAVFQNGIVIQFFTGQSTNPQAAVGLVGKTVIIRAASFTLAADAHLPYQRVNTATDYDADPSKFPAYHRLDGVDDSHVSATGGGGTAGFFLSAAVTPQGGAGTARTLFSDAGANTGYIVRLNTSNQLELAAGNGTAYTTIATAGTLAVNSTDVIQAWDDGANLNVKIGNGVTASVARPVVSAGTAGYTMGQDNGASTGYFKGRIHSTIYRKDSGLTQVLREAVALYQRQKARMP